MATARLYTSPAGSQLTSTINTRANPPETADKNDFDVYISFDENVVLTLSQVSVNNGASVVSLEGAHNVYKAVIRPPTTAAVITLSITGHTIAGGNTIRVSTRFPDADAEALGTLFSHGVSGVNGIAVSPTRIFITSGRAGANLYAFTHAGVENVPERVTRRNIRQYPSQRIDFINGDIIGGTGNAPFPIYRSPQDFSEFESLQGLELQSITHTRLGITGPSSRNQVRIYPYGETVPIEHDIPELDCEPVRGITHSNDLLYLPERTYFNCVVLEIGAQDKINFLRQLNVNLTIDVRDFAIYGDTLYALIVSTDVRTLDIRPYRPTAKNTKTTIYPVFAEAGDTIDLTQYAPDARSIIFDVGFEKPRYLSINSRNALTIAPNAVTETTPRLLKLRAINFIDSTPFQFYLVIVAPENPVIREVDTLTMRAGGTYDLNALVAPPTGLQAPPTVTFQSGQTQPTGSRIANGIFTIGTEGGTGYFTATHGGRSTDFEIDFLVVQASDPANFSDVFRERVEIAGIDVTDDVLTFPRVSASLDAVRLNRYTADSVTVTLASDSANGFRYNDGIQGNFWQTHGRNGAGYQERVNIYIESFVDGNWVSSLIFAGRILKTQAGIDAASVTVTCVDLTTELQNTDIRDFGTLLKWGAVRQRTDEATYQGIYTPENALLPIQTRAGEKVWNADGTPLELVPLALPSEGAPPGSVAHVTDSELQTAGGFLPDPPLMQFKGQHRAEDVRFLINQLALSGAPYNAEVDIPAHVLAEPTLLNYGSVSYSVEDTRITRLLTDWVYDATRERVLMVLSNPEGHIADVLVQYDPNRDDYRLLHVFEKDVKAHRIVRQNSTNYYILTSGAISQDRSAQTLPRATDSTGYAYDSAAVGSRVRIHRYNAATGALTQHVGADNAYPPQLGVQYHVGYENSLYIDEFEGILPNPYAAFKWVGGWLYYRYAKDGEFGVARVNDSGTTERLIFETDLAQHNHLNFAFDVTSGGVVYFAYATQETYFSTLWVKRRAADGTVTTLLQDRRPIGDVTAGDRAYAGYLGAMECLFHNNAVYLMCSLQSVDGDLTNPTAAPVVRVLANGDISAFNRNSVQTNTRVEPADATFDVGDNITIRINFQRTVNSATFSQSAINITGGTFVSLNNPTGRSWLLAIRPDNQNLHNNIEVHIISAGDNTGITVRDARILIDFGIARSREKSAGMALYRLPTQAATPTLTVVDSWDFVHYGGCNLTTHQGDVYYAESSPASAMFRGINSDLDDYAQFTTGSGDDEKYLYSIVPEPLGQLKRVNTDGTVKELGNTRYTDRPYNIFATRMLSIGEDLHISAAYGDLRELNRYNSLPSQADNVQHIVRTRHLRYIIPEFNPNGSRYAALADIALKINATLRFENGIIRISDRNPYRAKVRSDTGVGTGNIAFYGANKAFPERGYLWIGDEFIGYTGVAGGAFTGITRGHLKTAIADHAADADILYMDALISEDTILTDGFNFSTDTTRLYNVIQNSDGFQVRDPASIAQYAERVYTLDLGLTRHELAQQQQVFESYLQALSEVQQVVDIQRTPAHYLDAGSVIGFVYDRLMYVMQGVSVVKTDVATELQGRTVSLIGAPSPPDPTPTPDPDPTPEPSIATTLSIVSGNNQQDFTGETLANPFVVQVNDQNNRPMSGVDVSFSTDGGTLSNASGTTDSGGRAETTLTLPSAAGAVTVTAAVSGLTSVTFTATAVELVLQTFTARASDRSFTQPQANTAIDFGSVESAGSDVMSREDNNIYRLNTAIRARTLEISARFDVYIISGSITVDLRYASTPPTTSNIRTHGTSLGSAAISTRTLNNTLSGTVTNPASGVYFWIATSNQGFFPNKVLNITVMGSRTSES